MGFNSGFKEFVYELKKIGKVFTSKFIGTGHSSYEKRIYRAAVSQRLRNTVLHHFWYFLPFVPSPCLLFCEVIVAVEWIGIHSSYTVSSSFESCTGHQLS